MKKLYNVEVSMNLTVRAKSIQDAENIAEDLVAGYISEGAFGPTEYFIFRARKIPGNKTKYKYQIDNEQN